MRTTLEQRILAEIEAEILSDEALERVKKGLQSLLGSAVMKHQELSASPKLTELPLGPPSGRNHRRSAGFRASAYNFEHRHSAIRYVTPHERHSGREHDILERRRRLYQRARAANSVRWSVELETGPRWGS
jgi:hypothetical protein